MSFYSGTGRRLFKGRGSNKSPLKAVPKEKPGANEKFERFLDRFEEAAKKVQRKGKKKP